MKPIFNLDDIVYLKYEVKNKHNREKAYVLNIDIAMNNIYYRVVHHPSMRHAVYAESELELPK